MTGFLGPISDDLFLCKNNPLTRSLSERRVGCTVFDICFCAYC